MRRRGVLLHDKRQLRGLLCARAGAGRLRGAPEIALMVVLLERHYRSFALPAKRPRSDRVPNRPSLREGRRPTKQSRPDCFVTLAMTILLHVPSCVARSSKLVAT